MNEQEEKVIKKLNEILVAKEMNSQQSQLLNKLPMVVILDNILIFLEDSDILNFGSTCKTYNQLIFSPFYYMKRGSQIKQLAQIENQNQISNKEKLNESRSEFVPINMSHYSNNSKYQNISQEDLEDHFQALIKTKDSLVFHLKECQDYIIKQKEEIQELKNYVRKAHKDNMTITQQYTKLSYSHQILSNQFQDQSEIISQKDKNYKEKIDQIEEDLKRIQQEKNVLMGQKKKLIEEVKKLREEKEISNNKINNQQKVIDRLNILFKECENQVLD